MQIRADLTIFLLIYLGYVHAFAAIFSGLLNGIGMDAPQGYDMYLRLLRYTVRVHVAPRVSMAARFRNVRLQPPSHAW